MTTDTSALSPGLEGVPIAESSISQVDGEAGRLTYRGYSIEDLTRGTTFEEIVALLYDGELPDRARLDAVRSPMWRAARRRSRIRCSRSPLPFRRWVRR